MDSNNIQVGSICEFKVLLLSPSSSPETNYRISKSTIIKKTITFGVGVVNISQVDYQRNEKKGPFWIVVYFLSLCSIIP